MTLVELMIVVIIIGVLSSIASVAYKDFILRARKTEAKALLSGLFTAEKIFFSEYLSYTSVLDSAGYQPDGTVSYNVGFNNYFAPPVNAPQGSATCLTICDSICLGVNWVCKASARNGLDTRAIGILSTNQFIAIACAFLFGSSLFLFYFH